MRTLSSHCFQLKPINRLKTSSKPLHDVGPSTRKFIPKIEKVISQRIQDKTLLPWADFHMPQLTYCDFIWDNIEAHSHLPGLVCGLTGKTVLHGEVKEQALNVARALKSHDLKKGDVVAIVLPNCLEYPVLVQGCLYLGIAITPINPAYTANEISRQLSASKASVIFGHSSIVDKLKKSSDLAGCVKKSFLIGENLISEGALHWDDFIASSSGPVPEQADIDVMNDVAVLPFSSGTTGVPKGVMLSQHNLVVNNYSISCNDSTYMIAAAGLQQETTISVLPLYHIYGLNLTMSSGLHNGVKQVILPGFDPTLFVKAMEEYKPTFLHLVPPLMGFLANHPLVTPDHLKSLRQINVGAAPIGPTLITQFYKKAPKYTIFKEGWGLSEVAGGATGCHGPRKLGSCNQILPNLRLQIRDVETDTAQGPNTVGEIVLKGPHCMLGYSNNEEANKEIFDDDGWMRTGDIGYYDEDYHIFLVDRIKELIKVKGLQVAPAELEDVLRGLKGVKDVGVIGVKSEREGELPRAYIVREETLTEEMVHDYMKAQVSSHKQLAGGIEWIEAIPKSAAGKILRKELKELYNKESK